LCQLVQMEDGAVTDIVLNATGSIRVTKAKKIQELWSQCGYVARLSLSGSHSSACLSHVVVKFVTLGDMKSASVKSKRIARSYQAEAAFYRWLSSNESLASFVQERCRVPTCLAVAELDGGRTTVFVLEDLNDSGYPARVSLLLEEGLHACVCWLARFHGAMLEIDAASLGLWEQGNYWHLSTRPEELKALEAIDPGLWAVAEQIESKLRGSAFHTVVHGDPKAANFCFSQDLKQVAALDFQYVGGGVGVSDVCYLMHSCLDDDECEEMSDSILDLYFQELRTAVGERDGLEEKREDTDLDALESEWRSLFPFAVADFYRFYKGWSGISSAVNAPETWSERICRDVVRHFSEV
jgi:hypothetical protein